jgi:DNA-binding beta-propeller fold protein YncE/ABC-type Fe3+ transport system permease subunit
LSYLAPALVWLCIAPCCVAPLAWLAWQLAADPRVFVEAWPDAYRATLIVRTLLLNGAAGVLACAVAYPVAVAIGRGRSRLARALWWVTPVPLVLPSLVIGYAWWSILDVVARIPTPKTALWHALQAVVTPGHVADALRCSLSLGLWLWPIPALLMGLTLRRTDASLFEQAALDGVLGRVTFRRLLAPMLAGCAVVTTLALQEFAVYEPTGVSVIATEIRMVYDTGAMSSAGNPITQAFDRSLSEQPARVSAAVATALPMIVTALALGGLVWRWSRRAALDTAIETAPPSSSAQPATRTVLLAWLTPLLTLGLPLAGLLLTLRRVQSPAVLYEQFGPEVLASLAYAGGLAVATGFLLLLASVAPVRGAAVVAIVTFLVGGQILTIILIRLYNRDVPGLTDWLYDSPLMTALAWVGRYAWLALLAAGATYAGPWRELRAQASLDGAGPWRVAWHVVWPLAWPLALAAGLTIGALAVTEVPVAALLQPPTIVPMTLQWVHRLGFDPMIEASLLMLAMSVLTFALAAALWAVWRRRTRARFDTLKTTFALALLATLFAAGCDRGRAPDAIFGSTGRAPGQYVYPRAITYDPSDDTFWVIDRAGRVQQIDGSGRQLLGWAMPEFAMGKPVGVTVGPDGNLWVPDTHYHRIIVFDRHGKEVRRFGVEGSGPGEFDLPTDIAFDSKGRVFVSEYGVNNRIQIFDQQANYLGEFGKFGDGPDGFSRPQSILIKDDVLYVTDSCNHRVGIYTLDGKLIRHLGRVGTGPGELRFPYGLDLDAAGNVIVCEFGNNRVQKLDPVTGASLGIFGRAGALPGEFKHPWGVAVDRQNRVVAVDAGNNRLQVFRF